MVEFLKSWINSMILQDANEKNSFSRWDHIEMPHKDDDSFFSPINNYRFRFVNLIYCFYFNLYFSVWQIEMSDTDNAVQAQAPGNEQPEQAVSIYYISPYINFYGIFFRLASGDISNHSLWEWYLFISWHQLYEASLEDSKTRVLEEMWRLLGRVSHPLPIFLSLERFMISICISAQW